MTDRDPLAALQLMVRLLRRDTAGIERALRARSAGLAELATVAPDAGLSVPLLHALADTPWMHSITAEQREALARRRDRQRARYAVLGEGLVHLAGVFEAADLPFMLLKGPYLAARFYGGVQAREFVDLDLLIRQRDRERAFGLVARCGYARRSRGLGSDTLTASFVHGYDFVADGVNLDLHWALSRHPSIRIDEAAMWERKRRYAIDGREYDVPADEDAVTLVALGLLRDIERGRPKLRNVVDLIAIVAAIDPAMAWDAMFTRARAEGTYGPLVNALSLAVEAAAASDLAPRLAAALALHAGRRVQAPVAASLLQPGSARSRFANRIWALRAHDAAFATCIAWWALSLPFRRAAHGWPRPVATGAPDAR